MTRTLPGTATRDLSFRSTSVHVLNRVAAAGDGAADRAGLDPPTLDPDIHFGRGGNQEFATAEIDQRTVRRGVGEAQPLEDDARRICAGIGKELPDHNLEQIAAGKGRPRRS